MAGPVMLMIRDGWGINPTGPDKRQENGDATLLASTPFHHQLYRDYPGARLSASGTDVGLPDGQMGNCSAIAFCWTRWRLCADIDCIC
jgi:2,3-bisphosphoglycerate-independent phosphoglycerate mutase